MTSHDLVHFQTTLFETIGKLKALHIIATQQNFSENFLAEAWEEIGRLQVWGDNIFGLSPMISPPEHMLDTMQVSLTDLQTFLDNGIKTFCGKLDLEQLNMEQDEDAQSSASSAPHDLPGEVLQDISEIISDLNKLNKVIASYRKSIQEEHTVTNGATTIQANERTVAPQIVNGSVETPASPVVEISGVESVIQAQESLGLSRSRSREPSREAIRESVVCMETVRIGTPNRESADNMTTEQSNEADDLRDPFWEKAKESKKDAEVESTELVARAQEGRNGLRKSYDWGRHPSTMARQSGADDYQDQNNDQPQKSSIVSSIPQSRRSSLPEEVQSYGSQSDDLREEAAYISTAAEDRFSDDPDRLALAIIPAPAEPASPHLPQTRSNIAVESVPQLLEYSHGSKPHEASRSSKRPPSEVGVRPTVLDIPDERTNKQRHIAAERLIRWFKNPFTLHTNISTSEISKGTLNEDRLRPIFNSLDLENKGTLPNTDIKQALTNPDSTPFKQPTITALLERLYTARPNFLNFEDFCKLWGFVAAWRSLFDRFDEGRKGFFSIDDYIVAMKGLEWDEFMSQRGLKMSYYKAYTKDSNNDKMAFEIFIQSSLDLKSKVDRFKTYDPDGDGFTALSFESYLGDIMHFSSGTGLFKPEIWPSNAPQVPPEDPKNTSNQTTIEGQAISRNDGPPYSGIEQLNTPSMHHRISGLRNSVDRASKGGRQNRDSKDTALNLDKENRRGSFERIHPEPDLEEEPLSHLFTKYGDGEDTLANQDRYVSRVPAPTVDKFSSHEQNGRRFRSSSYGYGRERIYRRLADLEREEESIRQKKLWKEEVLLEIAKKEAEEKIREKLEEELKKKAIAEYIDEKTRTEKQKAENEMILQERMRKMLSKNGFPDVQIEKMLSRGSDKPSVLAQVSFEDTDDSISLKQRRPVGYQSSDNIPDITSYRTRSPLHTKSPVKRSERPSSPFPEAEQDPEPRLRRLARLAKKAAKKTLDAQLKEDLILKAMRNERVGLEWWNREAQLFDSSRTTYDRDRLYHNPYLSGYSDENRGKPRADRYNLDHYPRESEVEKASIGGKHRMAHRLNKIPDQSEGEWGEAEHEDVYNAIASGRRKRMEENEKVYDNLKAVPRRSFYKEEVFPGQVSEQERSRFDRRQAPPPLLPKESSKETAKEIPLILDGEEYVAIPVSRTFRPDPRELRRHVSQRPAERPTSYAYDDYHEQDRFTSLGVGRRDSLILPRRISEAPPYRPDRFDTAYEREREREYRDYAYGRGPDPLQEAENLIFREKMDRLHNSRAARRYPDGFGYRPHDPRNPYYDRGKIVIQEPPKREELYYSERPRQSKRYTHDFVYQERPREQPEERKRPVEEEASMPKRGELHDRTAPVIPEHERDYTDVDTRVLPLVLMRKDELPDRFMRNEGTAP